MGLHNSNSVRRRAWIAALSIFVGAVGQTAFAQDADGATEPATESSEEEAPTEPMELRLRGCPALSKERIFEILALELQTLQQESRPGRVEAQIVCFPSALVLSVSWQGQPSSDRRIEASPDSIPERSVALALSELVAEVWKGMATVSRPPSLPPEPAEAQAASPPPRRRQHALETSLFLSSYAAPRRASPGARLAYFHAPSPFFEWGLSARFDGGRVDDDIATVRQWTMTLAPHLRLRLPTRTIVFAAGLALPVGWVGWDPHAKVVGAEEASMGAVWGAVLGEIDVRVPFANRFFAGGGAGIGTVFLPVRGLAGDRSLLEISGLLAVFDLGIGVLF